MAKRALDAGFTKYTNPMGIPELRDAIAARASQENGIPAAPSSVMVTPTKHGVYCAVMALVDPGDEVILPDPGWVSYEPMVRLAGGVPVPVLAAEASGFRLLPEAVEAAVTPRTKLVVLNSPSNPAGGVMTREDVRGVAEVCADRDLFLVSDEIYEKLVFEGEHVSPASLPGMWERTVTVSGFSKTYAMTGWRLGWLLAPDRILAEIAKVQEHTLTCCAAFAQKAGVAALTGPEEPLRAMVAEFRARRELLLAGLRDLGWPCVPPRGAFFAFPRTPGGSVAFSERLLRESRVAVVPGSAFGAAGEGHLRLSFATSRERITEGLRRIAAVL
jgi:aspartate aminotransferase